MKSSWNADAIYKRSQNAAREANRLVSFWKACLNKNGDIPTGTGGLNNLLEKVVQMSYEDSLGKATNEDEKDGDEDDDDEDEADEEQEEPVVVVMAQGEDKESGGADVGAAACEEGVEKANDTTAPKLKAKGEERAVVVPHNYVPKGWAAFVLFGPYAAAEWELPEISFLSIDAEKTDDETRKGVGRDGGKKGGPPPDGGISNPFSFSMDDSKRGVTHFQAHLSYQQKSLDAQHRFTSTQETAMKQSSLSQAFTVTKQNFHMLQSLISLDPDNEELKQEFRKAGKELLHIGQLQREFAMQLCIAPAPPLTAFSINSGSTSNAASSMTTSVRNTSSSSSSSCSSISSMQVSSRSQKRPYESDCSSSSSSKKQAQ